MEVAEAKNTKLTKHLVSIHCKNIRRFYGKITDNQLPVHFPLFFTGACTHFQESGHYFFFVIQPYNPTKLFSSTVG